jgi:hypothetical protein
MARKRDQSDDPLEPPEDEREERDEPEASGDDGDQAPDASGEDEATGEQDLSDTTAPSIGPNTTFEKDDPEERLARHEQSDVDAMGLDKRREVIGGSYSPSVGRQVTMYGIFLGVVAALAIGFYLLAKNLDEPPAKYEDKAPWAQADAKQVKPPPIDFPNYGHPGPGESAEATPGESEGSATSENAADVETP